MLSWDDFLYVKAIADSRSLGGAAQSLGLTHSTVWRRLGQIEHNLRSRLFVRSKSGYTLTPCGEDMVRLADRIAEDITTFERRTAGQDLRRSGELRITTNDMVLLHLLTDVLAGFRRAYPEITLDIIVSNTLLNLSKRDADVAIRATYQETRSLIGRYISPIAWAVFGANSFDGTRFNLLADPVRHTWVAFADDTALARPAKWLKDHGVDESRIVYKVNTLLGIAEAVAHEIGLALLPCYIGETTPGIARLSPPLPELEGQLWIVAHPDLKRIWRVGAFLDFCETEMVRRCAPVCRSSPPEGAP
jgi:DNA-binding transcriptional LysR family regulator